MTLSNRNRGKKKKPSRWKGEEAQSREGRAGGITGCNAGGTVGHLHTTGAGHKVAQDGHAE